MTLWSRMLGDAARNADSDLDSADGCAVAESDSVDEATAPARETSAANSPQYAIDWCPDCDTNTPHLRISQYAVECQDCGEIKETQ